MTALASTRRPVAARRRPLRTGVLSPYLLPAQAVKVVRPARAARLARPATRLSSRANPAGLLTEAESPDLARAGANQIVIEHVGDEIGQDPICDAQTAAQLAR